MSDPCFDKLKSLGTLTDAEVKDVLEYVDGLRSDPAGTDKIRAKAAHYAEAAKIKQFQARKTAEAWHRTEERRLRPALNAIKDGKLKDIYKAASGWLVGKLHDTFGNQWSVDAEMRGNGAAITNFLQKEFYRRFGKGWMRLSKDPAFVTDLVREMSGTATQNPLAKEMADVFNRIFSSGIRRLNAAGAHIAELDKYGFTQSHSPYKLAIAGEGRWAELVRPGLDERRTFGGDDPDRVLHEIWLNIRHGEYVDPDSVGQGANIAESLSAHRRLFFKDAESAIEYHKNFGNGNVMSALFDHAARQRSRAVLMEHMGPDPQAFFDRLVKTLKNVSREHPNPLSKGQELALRKQFDAVTGRLSEIVHPKVAALGDFLTTFAGSLPKLGFSAISSFSDTINMRTQLEAMGYSTWESYAKSAARFLKFLTFQHAMTDEERQALWAAGAGMHAMNMHVASRWSEAAPMQDWVRRAQSIMFMLNRQTAWDNHFMFATSASWMHMLARNADTAFDDLHPHTRAMLLRTGFDKPEWDALRATEQVESDGYKYLTPDKVKNKELASRYIGALYDLSGRTVPLPGAQQISTMRLAPRGTPMGELGHFIAQFKTFPLGIMQRVWPMAAKLHGNPALGLGEYALGATVLGYVSLALKNVLSGQEPPDPADWHTWTASAAQGGSGSIFADLLLPGHTQGHELSGVFSGPVVEEAQDFLTAAKAGFGPGRASAEHKMAEAAVPILRSDVPFANLWFSKLAWQYGIVYPTMESLHPGALHRMQETAQNEYNEKFWMKPGGGQ